MKRRWQGISYEREKSFSSRFTSEPLNFLLCSRGEKGTRLELNSYPSFSSCCRWTRESIEEPKTEERLCRHMMMSQYTDLNQKSRESNNKMQIQTFFSIDYFFVTVRSCCIETSSRWRQKLLQHRRRRRQNKTTWSKVSDVLNNEENRTRRRPARFISSAEAGTADSSLRQNLFRKGIFHSYFWCFFFFSLL